MADVVAQLPLSFAAGLISVLSPCVLPLMPAFLALLAGPASAEISRGTVAEVRHRMTLTSVGFLLGFSAVFVVMGVGAFPPGHWLRSWRSTALGLDVGLSQLAGLGIAALGLYYTGLIPGTRPNRGAAPAPPRRALPALLVGAGFGLGWSPCVGPILSNVLSLAADRATAAEGVLLLTVYSAGLAVPFLLAARALALCFGRDTLSPPVGRVIGVVCGALLAGAGSLLVFNQFTRLNRTFAVLGDWVVALEGALL